MKNIVAIKYIDALYYKKYEKLKFTELTTHVAMGEVISISDDHLTLSFVNKNGIPEKGLLIPKNALIFEKDTLISKKFNLSDSHIGFDIGVFWNDLVYFQNGKIPRQCTHMYSEGKLFSVTNNTLIIKNPETIKVREKNVAGNHLGREISLVIIPKSLIANFELYDKKLQ